ncbi:MAG: molybdopterin-binding oxidoreductase [Candidatus Entotheonella factor]|uniref:Molybdopterin-binding oxidoreductase n=2 Tax=Candidatus Entotheonella TaxID=93171 RepID=W4LB02_ENTF1|nr:MAG: molybdopterin-binding oxidoreductase [Candidatus Entotheonella factor]
MAQTLPSVCPLDCPDTCSMTVTVEDDHIVNVRGSRVNPLTRGAVCQKVTRYPEWVHGPSRLQTPLRRVGQKGEGRFEAISWEAALDEIYGRFTAIRQDYGSQAITPLNYSGPHGLLAVGSMDLRFFYKLGASRLARRPLCGGIKSEALVGTYGAVPLMRPEHVAHAQLIIVWGVNVTVSQLHLMHIIRTAQKQGAKLIVVDPRRTQVARHADLHVALKPGTDGVLALALAAELERINGLDHEFIADHVLGAEAYLEQARSRSLEASADICGLTPADIRQMAELYKTISPAVICPGNGPERNQNGGSSLQAIFALPALGGKFGVLGGGLLQGASSAFPKTLPRLQGDAFIDPQTRTLNIVTLGRDLLNPDLDPPIKGVFIYNHNPVIVHPDQNTMKRALSREDLFTVVCDVVMTDSAAYADVVLPACSHFEYADLYPAYGQHFLQRAEPVIPPVGESLPNTEIFRRLAARFGFTEPEFQASDAELIDDAVDGDDIRLQGIAPSQLPTDEVLLMTAGGEDAILYQTTFPATPSGKIELESSYLKQAYNHPLPTFRPVDSDYPLSLISPASDKRTSSTFGDLPYSDAIWLDMHPDDATARQLEDGMWVRMWNELGEVHLPLRVTDEVRPGVVCSEKGLWFRTSDNGQTVSALAPAHTADLSEGACYNDTRVEVDKWEQ